ncbi:MAG: ABC transporter permease [Spirulinaceae cyanobacterium]
MSWLRIWAIAHNGFRETIRDRILYAVGVYGLLLVLAIRILPEVAASLEDPMLADLGLGAMGLLGAIAAIFVGTTLVSKEIEQRTLLVLLPKPLSRAELILGKHLGLWAVVGVMILAMTGIYGLALALAKAPLLTASTLVAALYLWLELAVLIAVALFFGSFTQGALATLLSFGVYGIGHLNTDWVELARLSESPGLKRLLHGLYFLLPDLSRLNWRNDAVYGLLPSGGELAVDALYALSYTVFLLVLAMVIFARRQF